MKRSPIYLLAAVLLGVVGCSTHGLPPPDLSREAYEAFVQKCADLDLPPQPYEDWKLFQSQRDLHELHRRQLDLDVNDFTNNAPFLIVFESWGEFANAESEFRKRAASAGVTPADAFRTYHLSDRQRRAIGQWECRIGVTPEDGGSADPRGTKPEPLSEMQSVAREQLVGLKPDAKEAPYAAKLCSLATEELANSDKAWTDGDERSALQWARDAIVTAKSARALSQMESLTSR